MVVSGSTFRRLGWYSRKKKGIGVVLATEEMMTRKTRCSSLVVVRVRAVLRPPSTGWAHCISGFYHHHQPSSLDLDDSSANEVMMKGTIDDLSFTGDVIQPALMISSAIVFAKLGAPTRVAEGSAHVYALRLKRHP